jgi:uncharacterized protein YjeT (DUF2065 family)
MGGRMDSEEQNLDSERISLNAAHQKAIRALKSREPDEWKRLIKKLTIPYLPMPAFGVTDEHIRTNVACIVWWDFFGGRPTTDRWPHLDIYLKRPYVWLPRAVMIEGLVILGYPPKWAEARIGVNQYKEKHI